MGRGMLSKNLHMMARFYMVLLVHTRPLRSLHWNVSHAETERMLDPVQIPRFRCYIRRKKLLYLRQNTFPFKLPGKAISFDPPIFQLHCSGKDMLSVQGIDCKNGWSHIFLRRKFNAWNFHVLLACGRTYMWKHIYTFYAQYNNEWSYYYERFEVWSGMELEVRLEWRFLNCKT